MCRYIYLSTYFTAQSRYCVYVYIYVFIYLHTLRPKVGIVYIYIYIYICVCARGFLGVGQVGFLQL